MAYSNDATTNTPYVLSSGQLYKDVTECVSGLVEDLYNAIFERIATMMLDGNFTIASFLKENETDDEGEERKHIFYSTYQKDIIRRVRKKLNHKGYACKIVTNGTRIHYTTRIVSPFTRLAKLCLLYVTPFLVAGALYQGMSMRTQDMHAKNDGYNHIPHMSRFLYDARRRNSVAVASAGNALMETPVDKHDEQHEQLR